MSFCLCLKQVIPFAGDVIRVLVEKTSFDYGISGSATLWNSLFDNSNK